MLLLKMLAVQTFQQEERLYACETANVLRQNVYMFIDISSGALVLLYFQYENSAKRTPQEELNSSK
jgi:hypothetical protein